MFLNTDPQRHKEIKDFTIHVRNEMRNDIQEAYKIGMSQVEKEIEGLLDFYNKLNVRNVMEIGTYNGGLFYLLCKNAMNLNKAISVDIPYDGIGITIEERDNLLRTFAKNVFPISMNSHSQECL